MPDLDLKFTPDWLKDDAPTASYQNFAGEPDRPAGRDRGRPGQRGDAGRGERRGARRDFRDQKGGQRDKSRPAGRERRHDHEPLRPPREDARPAPVKVEFLPEPVFIEPIARQIRSSGRAYPLVDVARMFLDQPERYRVKVTATDPAFEIFCCGGDGPVSTARAMLERQAFDVLKEKYYAVEVTQGEPPKGDYTNVARCRLTGGLIAPTNHHSYPHALRRLYTARFSRRMSFEEFQREIEVVREPEAVEAWKEEARTVTTYKTLSEPVETFASEDEARQHFARHHLAEAVRSGNSFEVSGRVSRHPGDPRLFGAMRAGFHEEEKFPGQIAHHLRVAFAGQHLHVFKWGGKRQYVSAVRPRPFLAGQGELAPNIAAILRTVDEVRKCSRKELVERLVPAGEDFETRRNALFADLHWLIGLGHVVEFHDGVLAVASKKPPAPAKQEAPRPPAAAPAEASEPAEPAPPAMPTGNPPAAAAPGQPEAEPGD